jgi:hypothetical protein
MEKLNDAFVNEKNDTMDVNSEVDLNIGKIEKIVMLNENNINKVDKIVMLNEGRNSKNNTELVPILINS